MSDYGLLAIELIRSQSRYMQAERELAACRANLTAASEDLWQKTNALMDAGYALAEHLSKRTEQPA